MTIIKLIISSEIKSTPRLPAQVSLEATKPSSDDLIKSKVMDVRSHMTGPYSKISPESKSKHGIVSKRCTRGLSGAPFVSPSHTAFEQRPSKDIKRSRLFDPNLGPSIGKPRNSYPYVSPPSIRILKASKRIHTNKTYLKHSQQPMIMLNAETGSNAHVPSLDASIQREFSTDSDWTDVEPELLLQPETRPISHEQLMIEIKGIYAGLVMVEAKCIDVDAKQTADALERDPAKKTKLTTEQWSALIALHETLLHEHHDFFLASQHPSAGRALSELAATYSMPARMWRHGIHAFLEVLRHRLPHSLDHMLTFIYIVYSMMAVLYETVPSFEDTWIECLGDLARYRMAIEDDDIRDREVWSGVAWFWYSKAADKSPKVRKITTRSCLY